MLCGNYICSPATYADVTTSIANRRYELTFVQHVAESDEYSVIIPVTIDKIISVTIVYDTGQRYTLRVPTSLQSGDSYHVTIYRLR